MEPIFALMSSFPTVIYTVPLLICLIFWLLGIFGVIDPEFLDADAAAEGGLTGLLATFGLTGVPLTLSLSLLFFFAWAGSLFASAWGLPFIVGLWLSRLAGLTVLLVSFSLAVLITGKITRPLSKLFVTHEARSNLSLVSKNCEIVSLTVGESFGQAKVEDGGAGLIISVRAETPNSLHKGDLAFIYQYDADKNLYHVLKQD